MQNTAESQTFQNAVRNTAKNAGSRGRPKSRYSKRKLTLYVPNAQIASINEECSRLGISVSELSSMLYSWVINRKLEIEIVKKVRERGSDY